LTPSVTVLKIKVLGPRVMVAGIGKTLHLRVALERSTLSKCSHLTKEILDYAQMLPTNKD